MFNLQKIGELLKKSKIGIAPFIVLFAGIGILLLPNMFSRSAQTQNSKETQRHNGSISFIDDITAYTNNLEQRLSLHLSEIDGVGRISVMITIDTNWEIEYNKDIKKIIEGDKNDYNEQTVLIQDSARNEIPLIKREISPRIRGAAIVCDGADNPLVEAKIIETVKTVLGIPVNRISVAKRMR